MNNQEILTAGNNYNALDVYFKKIGAKKVFLVCGKSLRFLPIGAYFDTLFHRMGIEVVRFSDFQPNPRYESVVTGVKLFCQASYDIIVAAGGGSAMDVAKCIKLYSNMDHSRNYLEQSIVPNQVPFLAVPTTAGTGSEATRYAVIYYKGEKQSVTDESCIPSAVLLDTSVLTTLPLYQKKATMMDAFCHAVESFWSVNSTKESKAYSKQAIRLIMENKELYLENDETGNARMLEAANLAGKAINITQTTAGHAMCYKLTSLYGIAHGHAAALCISKLWPYMWTHLENCVDTRGTQYLRETFYEIADAMGAASVENAALMFETVLECLNLPTPVPKPGDYAILTDSVNPIRLNNNPVRLDREVIEQLYRTMLTKEAQE